MDSLALIVVIAALLAGLALGWFVGNRGVAQARADRDKREADFKAAISDLVIAEERASQLPALRDENTLLRDERDEARLQLTELRTRAEAFEERLEEFKGAREAMAGQFRELATTMLGETQKAFLERAEARFRQSEEVAGQNLKSMLQPVSDRLQRYEEGVAKVEAERRDAFGELKGQIEQMRIGQEKVSSEAAKLVNSLRNAPKSRGRWGEQQLKNVLETCGLAEHTDFQTEVNTASEDGGRLRPDAIVRVPGGRALVIDAKVSLNAYQDAFGAVDEGERHVGLAAHAASMKAHINALGNKAYWSQFEDAPDYVIMFVPGEHFLSAALEHDHTLWDFAFEKRVLLATPTNLIAIARTVAAVWRQEKLAKEARQIGELGKELYDRLAKALGDLRVVGSGLNTAVKNFNTFANSLETRALVSARKLKELNIETGAREIEAIPPVELLASHAGEPEAELKAAE
ncbi:DNA recombination protein RmuC [Sphingomonas sp. HF-S4]|uniref:DNA recombination protein RmuC homolog n=1 Tax=Sphingomonas agrestis TaxID=3080540 RepID=A0ABU3Y4R2_9SPHN|nr:DNA recombination protein RmuC [Sphingomonas sp. HF-S4]MDV3456394.1 DNA recombination protein RmuC [Sphingomonas sp. HF-S4]